MKKIGIALAFALVAVPSALAGPSPNASDKARAAKACNAIRAQIGPGAFKQLYAPATHRPRAAGRNCLASMTRFEHRNRENPEWKAACAALQGPPADRPAGSQAANSYGKCVSALARAKSNENRQDTISAAQQCKAERRNANFATEIGGGETFAEFYGTNANNKNAFGRCVAQKKAAAQQPTP